MTQEAYNEWWNNVVSAMQPLPDEDIEEFAHRMTALAWFNGENAEREALAKALEDASKAGRIVNLTFALKAIQARGQA